MRRSPGLLNAISLLGAFLAASMVLGVLGAGLFVPAASLVGNTTKSAIGTFDALPAEFTVPAFQQQTRIYDRTGKNVIAVLATENRVPVHLDQIAPILRTAQVAIEDDRFYEHGGVDPRGVMRAFVSTLRRNTQGASTITQQYVKQTLLAKALASGDKQAYEAAQTQSGVAGVIRKLQEAKYAIALEKKLTKDQILEGYMNIAFYGANAYGVQAAAQRYFSVDASKVNLQQAALLAGMVQRPTVTNPLSAPKAALKRRNTVLLRMYQLKKISNAAYKKAAASPLGLKPSTPKLNCSASNRPYLCDYLTKWLKDQPALGKDEPAREKTIYTAGLNIRSTFDLGLIDKVNAILAPRNGSNRGAAAAVVEPGTGNIIAFGQSTKYQNYQVNWAVDTKYGASNGFQIGSTAKAFAVVTAMEQGWSAGTMVNAPPSGTRYSFGHMTHGQQCDIGANSYAPSNAESKGEDGVMSLQKATADSVNTAFLEIDSRLGLCAIKDTMAKMGLHNGNGKAYGTSGPAAVVLGAEEASPVTVAAAYATIASGGTYCAPTPVTSIVGFDGTKYDIPDVKARCKGVIDSSAAYRTTKILQTVLTEGTARHVPGIGRPAAGKTGTADESKQTWFAGFTPQLSTAVWYGTWKRVRPMPGIYGADVAGPLWSSIMRVASTGLPVRSFHMGDVTVNNDSTQSGSTAIPDVTGRGRYSAARTLENAGFTVRIGPRVRSTQYGYNQVVYTVPDGGMRANPGDTVTLYLSAGSPAAASPTTTNTAYRPRPSPTRTPSPSATSKPSQSPTPKKNPTPSTSATPKKQPTTKKTPTPKKTATPKKQPTPAVAPAGGATAAP